MKTSFRSIIAVLVLTGFTSVMASPSMTFTEKTESQRFRWKKGPIKLFLSTSLFKASPNIKPESDIAGAIKRAGDAWSEAADVEFQFEQSDKSGVSAAGASGDGVNLITVAPSPENVLFFAKDAQTSAAKTRVFYDRKGTITEADIVLNPFQQFSTDGTYGTFDLQSALTHEIGHLLGLRHSDVAGSIMSDNLTKNAAVGPSEFQPRTLADSDVASVREIYGVGPGNGDCCSSISGKLTLTGGRPAKGLKVWVEESVTGRVVGQGETSIDGTYRVGGLDPGSFMIYWRSKGDSGDVGSVELEKDTGASLDARVSLESATMSAEFIGREGELSESAVQIGKDTESLITIAGKNLRKVSKLSFTSPFLHVADVVDDSEDLGDGVSSVRFYIRADAKAPAGLYSVFLSSGASDRTAFVGAIRIR